MLVNNRIEFLEILFGASLLGATVAPLSTWSTRSELDFLLRDSSAEVLFTIARLGKQDIARDVASVLGEPGAPAPSCVVVIDGDESQGWLQYEDMATAEPLVLPAPGISASASDPMVILVHLGFQ